MARQTRILRWLLFTCGALTLLALPAVFLPRAAMSEIHRGLGLGELPEGPIVLYLARSLSFFYAAFGALTLLLATDVNRYAPLITWWGVSAITLGVFFIGIDLTAGMPIDWMLGEVIFAISPGVAVLLLQRRAGSVQN